MDKIQLKVPSKPQYVSTLRLVTASVAQMMHFDYESVEDLRVCISEAVNYLLPINEEIDVCFENQEEALKITISAKIEENNDANDMCRMILESLLSEVEYKDDCIVLVKTLS